MTVLETRNLTKEFPGVRALSDFSFTLEKGEIHGLVGENGAGKSTLVKILAGVHTPTSGSFLLNGREMHFRSPRDAAERIGVVHQERELVPHFSGWENLFLGLEFSSAGFLRKRKCGRMLSGSLKNTAWTWISTPPRPSLAADGRRCSPS